MWIYLIGLLAQGFFSARILVQWILSEKHKKVLSPTIFWILSIFGSIFFFFYGWLRNDFSIILGQLISYYIYIWNLNLKNVWTKIPLMIRFCLLGLPFFILGLVISDFNYYYNQLFNQKEIPLWLILFGSEGQIIFTLRFIYQWYYSYKQKKSVLPITFWIISLIGSASIITYGIIRLDYILILGQSVGFIAYTRNIIIDIKASKNKKIKE